MIKITQENFKDFLDKIGISWRFDVGQSWLNSNRWNVSSYILTDHVSQPLKDFVLWHSRTNEINTIVHISPEVLYILNPPTMLEVDKYFKFNILDFRSPYIFLEDLCGIKSFLQVYPEKDLSAEDEKMIDFYFKRAQKFLNGKK